MTLRLILYFCLINSFILPNALLAKSLLTDSVSVEKKKQEGNDEYQLVFLHFNDFYEIEGRNGKGGLLSLSRRIEQQKQKYPEAIVTFGGDLLSPSLYSGVTKGQHMVDALALLQVDIAVPGNHEFDFGMDNAVHQFSRSKFPWVFSNVNSLANNRSNSVAQIYIHEINGLKIGFLGLITPELGSLSRPQLNLKISAVIESAEKMVRLLKKQDVDLIVALTHLTLEEDQQLAQKVKEIDLILGGHDHYPISLLINNTLIFKSGYNGEYLGFAKLIVHKSRLKQATLDSWAFLSTSFQNEQLMSAQNKELEHYLKNYQQQLLKEKDKHLVNILVSLDARKHLLRSAESSFAHLVTDALKQHYNSDIALINGGAIRSDKIYSAGSSLSKKELLAALPFANRAVTVKLRGAQILEILEYGVSAAERFSGRFPQFSGLRVEFFPDAEPGRRIGKILINNKPIELNKNYTMTTIDYLFQGGDGYQAFNGTQTLIGTEEGELLANIVAKYLLNLKQIKSVTMGRLNVLKK